MTSELPEQLRELADSLDCCQWNHPITGVRTCVEAAQEIERLRSEVERLKRLFGRDNPVECPVCGQIREASEMHCGQCTYRLDVSDGGDE